MEVIASLFSAAINTAQQLRQFKHDAQHALVVATHHTHNQLPQHHVVHHTAGRRREASDTPR